jgi:hypothetical protein
MSIIKKWKRFCLWFHCEHKNQLRLWRDGEGWNILICRQCSRAWIFTDGADREKSEEDALRVSGNR